MKPNHLSISGPFTHRNLSIFLVTGADSFDGARFIPLDQAMEQKCVIVHETGNVGQLEVENLSDELDLYIQAGDVVKGGRQDRTLGVDFVLPAKSGRTPIPSYCVESGRWNRRAKEDSDTFSSSKSYLSTKKLRMAAKLSRGQGEVWKSVATAQSQLSAGVGKLLQSDASPTSYQLTVEDSDLQKRQKEYREALGKTIDRSPSAVGLAFAINGEINTVDIYGSSSLFLKLWNKLLDAAILEAIGALNAATSKKKRKATGASVRRWLDEAGSGAASVSREIPPRIRVEIRHSKMGVQFDTLDHGHNDLLLHKNIEAN